MSGLSNRPKLKLPQPDPRLIPIIYLPFYQWLDKRWLDKEEHWGYRMDAIKAYLAYIGQPYEKYSLTGEDFTLLSLQFQHWYSNWTKKNGEW